MKNPFDPNKQAGYWNTWESGHDAGLKEGARRERRALRTWGNVDLGVNVSRRVIVDQYLSKGKPDAWLASRKRKGGKK